MSQKRAIRQAINTLIRAGDEAMLKAMRRFMHAKGIEWTAELEREATARLWDLFIDEDDWVRDTPDLPSQTVSLPVATASTSAVYSIPITACGSNEV